ncbi:MAG TPA: hypothetical protein VIJ94_09590 [Caulobacteraceae bacterium]
MSALAEIGRQYEALVFDVPSHSKSEVVRSGEVLREEFGYPYPDHAPPAFGVANHWRTQHIEPMRRVRTALAAMARNRRMPVGQTAARLKRMPSIRKKLRNTPLTLFEIQDIAGCRIIAPTMAEAAQFRDACLANRLCFDVHREDDYIAKPRASGYRSYHLRAKLKPGEEVGDLSRYKVEIQVRSQLQHAWATAVEAVGLVRKEDLKGGQGDGDWLRLFTLMSGALAAEEGAPPVPGVDDNPALRREELCDLDGKLRALDKLQRYKAAINNASVFGGGANQFFLIKFDRKHMTVSIDRGYFSRHGPVSYYDNEIKKPDEDSVLVEVDRVSELKAAYPNYFLDVTLFANRLAAAMGHGEENKAAPTVADEPEPPADSWRAWARRKGFFRA